MNKPTKIHLLANTMRSVEALRELRSIAGSEAEITVTSTPPYGSEPNYLPALGDACKELRASFGVTVDPKRSPFCSPSDEYDLTLLVNWRSKIAIPDYGQTFVIHDSLLPKLRGHSPLVRAILNGDSIAGATMFVPTSEIDAGPIVAQESFALEPSVRIAEAFELMTSAYLRLVRAIVPLVLEGHTIESRPQTGEPTYAPRIDWERDPQIDLSWPDERIERHIRAFSPPYPRAFAVIAGRKIFLS